MQLNCPMWVYSAVCALVAQRFLAENISLEAFAAKYAEVLAERYKDINHEMVLDTAETYLRHLMEAEVEDASEILDSFSYNRIKFDQAGTPRRIKGFFSSSLEGVKTPEVTSQASAKEFKPFIYMFRTKPDLAKPAGWTWDQIEDGEWLKELPDMDVDFMDGL